MRPIESMCRLVRLRWLAAFAVGVGVAVGQERPTPAAQVRQAVAAARASGRLARVAGEYHFLPADGSAVCYRIMLGDDGSILVESERWQFGAPLPPLAKRRRVRLTDRVSLSSVGAVVSMSATASEERWGETVARATVQGDRLIATRKERGVQDVGDRAPWDEARLPPLVGEFLWPLLVDEGELRYTRISLPAFGPDPLSGNTESRLTVRDGGSVRVTSLEGRVTATIHSYQGHWTLERDADGRLLSVAGTRAVTRERWQVVVDE